MASGGGLAEQFLTSADSAESVLGHLPLAALAALQCTCRAAQAAVSQLPETIWKVGFAGLSLARQGAGHSADTTCHAGSCSARIPSLPPSAAGPQCASVPATATRCAHKDSAWGHSAQSCAASLLCRQQPQPRLLPLRLAGSCSAAERAGRSQRRAAVSVAAAFPASCLRA